MPPRLTPFGLFLMKHKIPTAAAAEALGLTRQHVHALEGGRTPSLKLAFRIRRWSAQIAPKEAVEVASWEPWVKR